MSEYVSALPIGVVCGLRSMTGPAVVSWAARLGWLHLEGTPVAFLGSPAAPWILTVMAIGELIADKLPNTPSRKAPLGFTARVASGALCGGAVCAPFGRLVEGVIFGVIGAVVGTLGGYEARKRLVRAIGGKDLPIALLEDAVAIVGAIAFTGGFA